MKEKILKKFILILLLSLVIFIANYNQDNVVIFAAGSGASTTTPKPATPKPATPKPATPKPATATPKPSTATPKPTTTSSGSGTPSSTGTGNGGNSNVPRTTTPSGSGGTPPQSADIANALSKQGLENSENGKGNHSNTVGNDKTLRGDTLHDHGETPYEEHRRSEEGKIQYDGTGIEFDGTVKGSVLEYDDKKYSASDIGKAQDVAWQAVKNGKDPNEALKAAGYGDIDYVERDFRSDGKGGIVSDGKTERENVTLIGITDSGGNQSGLNIPINTGVEQKKTTKPKTTQPKTTAPKTTAPKTTKPKTTAPKTTQPKTTAPKTTAPKTTQPKTTQPKTTAPKTTTPPPPPPPRVEEDEWTVTYTHPDEWVDERGGSFNSGKTYEPDKTSYSDHNPYISTSIYDTEEDFALFDVTKHIPTKENIVFDGTAQQALYDVDVVHHTPSTWAAATACSCAYFSELHSFVDSISYKRTDTYETNEDGEEELVSSVTVVTNVTYGYYKRYGYKASNQVIPKKTNSKDLNDVPRSDIYPLSESNVYAQQDTYILKADSGTNLGIPGLDESLCTGPASMGISCSAPASITTTYEQGTFTSESAAASAASAGLPATVEKVTADLATSVANSISCVTAQIAYEFCGLKVESDFNANTTKVTGEITIPRASKSAKGLIPETYPNGTYEGKGKFVYSGAETFTTNNGQTKPKPNDVIVLAPVHNTTTVAPTSSFIDQRVNPVGAVAQLDSTFSLVVDVKGTQISDPGYNGNMDTSRWVKEVKIKIPFDVYEQVGETTNYIPAGTEITRSGSEISDGKLTLNFIVPVWTVEKSHQIDTKVYAVNSEHGTGSRKEFNNAVSQYIATNDGKLEIIGKIYDLQINNSTDPDWLNKVQGMKASQNRDYVIANEFPFGRTKGNAGERSQNSNSIYTYAPKVGYTFAFNFKTKGRKSNNIDIEVGKNSFYFVSKSNGSSAVPVDLYYKSSDGANWLKIGADGTDNKLAVSLSSSYLKVVPTETTDSNRIYPLEIGKSYNYGLRVNIGTFSNIKMPHSMRLTYNNFNEYMTDNGGEGLYKQTKSQIENNAKLAVAEYGFNSSETGSDMVIGSVGRWYAGYALPASTVAVSKNTSNPASTSQLPGTELKDGYILVGMDIKTKNTPTINTVGGTDYLKYNGPRAINEATGKEQETNVPEKDWEKPFNPSDPTTYKEVQIQGIPVKTKVPNNIVAIFETISAQSDINTVLSH